MGFEGITGGPGGSYKLRKIVGLSNYSYRRPEKGEEIAFGQKKPRQKEVCTAETETKSKSSIFPRPSPLAS